MPAISVILPVYQAEKTLERAVRSVREQTFSDWELLAVDDASTDSSGDMCERFAEADQRIRVFHQPSNAGVSAARNRGLREAAGEHIAFLDADDAFVPRTLETLWNLRREAGTDAAGCAHWNISPSGAEAVEFLLPGGVYDGPMVRERLIRPLFGERLRVPMFNGFLWRYLLSGQRVRETGMTFEGAYLEDELFLLEYFCGGGTLAVTEQPLYRYYQNPASATRHYMGSLAEELSRVMERKEALSARYGLDRDCPDWRNNANWANLLILIVNEYAHGNPKSMRERQPAVEALCRRPEMARAIRELKPADMGRNKQLVSALVRARRFGLLTLLYRVKNRM